MLDNDFIILEDSMVQNFSEKLKENPMVEFHWAQIDTLKTLFSSYKINLVAYGLHTLSWRAARHATETHSRSRETAKTHRDAEN